MSNFTKEQQEAIDLEGCNILVSAGAGSGKTAVLSERVLRKIKEGVSIDNLLVLTFTNAAAAEMKERIRDKVGKVESLKEEFDKVEASYITTFDAFTLSIVKKYHYLKNLDKDINVCNASILTLKKSQILDDLFESYYESNNEDFLSLIKTYCFKDDRDIKNFVRNSQSSIDLFYDKKEFFNNFFDTYYSEEFFTKLEKDYMNIINESFDNVKYCYEELSLLDYEYAVKCNLDSLLSSSTYEDIYKHLDYKLATIPRGSDDTLKEAKENLSEGLKNLKGFFKYETLSMYIDDMRSIDKSLHTLVNVIKEYDTLVDNYKIKYNLYDFLDIEKLAIDILRENEDVRLYFKDRFNEILIDEYQDTSDIQEVFTSLISNNNVYMVGDIKQSIYRFRNANPDIFRTKFNDYGKEIGGKRIDLNKNFRSREEVLMNINLIFKFLMDDHLGGADYEKEHQLIFGNKKYNELGSTEHSNDFEILNYTEDEDKKFAPAEIEIFIMADDILNKVESKYEVFDKDNDLKRPITYDDFAILTDNSKHYDLVKKIFNYKNIPLMVYKDESIKESINIKIIKNIFVLIRSCFNKTYNKEFEYAFVSIARSYLFSLKDEEIISVLKEKKYFKTDVIKKVNVICDNLDNKNIYDILKEIIQVFEIYEKIILIGSIDSNYAVLEYILSLGKECSLIYTIDEFIDYLSQITYGDIDIKLSLSKGDNDSVKLMTIHRSKGLEYPVIYCPFLAQKFNDADIKSKFTFDNKLGIIMPAIKEGQVTLFTKDILKYNFKRDDVSEKLRLFYVALTRAKEKFIFIANIENKKNYAIAGGVVNNFDRMKYNNFRKFLESIYPTLVSYTTNILFENVSITKDYDFFKKVDYKTSLAKSDELLEIQEVNYDEILEEDKIFSKASKNLLTKKEKNIINEGLKIHKIMEELDFANIDLSKIDTKYINIVENFIKTNILEGHINLYKEYEFMYKIDNINMHGIIDLLIEKKDEFIILDYKLSNIENDAYVKQLNGYKEYIESITDKKVSICLYSLYKGEMLEL
ncbi:MAG: UvrD-helicase domain-containing protein [bacterium]